jgi:hypothetical protein
METQRKSSCRDAAGLANKNHWYAHKVLVGSPHAFGGKPACTWWEAHMHLVGCSAGGVFSPEFGRKNTTKKPAAFTFALLKLNIHFSEQLLKFLLYAQSPH